MKALAIIALAGCYFQLGSAGAGYANREIMMTNDGPYGSWTAWKIW
jgi:hypothetical protein